MALVNVIQVTVLDNPTSFTNPFQFEITFECLQELSDDLEWKVIYVGSAEDANADQTLEEVMVGPVPVGINKFVLQAAAPDISQIQQEDLIGVTVVLVICSFKDQEFLRIGYYVNNEYPDYDPENPPTTVEISKLFRSILADQPRVTRFNIDWTGKASSTEDVIPLTEEIIDENDLVMMDQDEEEEEEEDEEDEADDNEEVDLEDEEADADLEGEGEMEGDEADADDEEEEEGEGEAADDMAITLENEDSMDVLKMQQSSSSGPTHTMY